ncbi:Protein Y37E11AL.2 [Aphelenchoides avenae]|nr:Protein Y37E11AL.2 [Aphelenchus avenae]
MVPLVERTPQASVRSTKSQSSSEASIRSGRSKRGTLLPTVRFNASLLTLITVSLTSMMCHSLALSDSGIFRFIGNTFLLLTAFFGYEWTRLYAPALTRVKHAFFDEANVLETYQPRARTHGHLFVPDPPTPGPAGGPSTASSSSGSGVKFADGDDVPERSESERAHFDALRKQHYGNEFEIAQRLMKEQENAGKTDDSGNVNTAAEPSVVETAKEKSAKSPSSVRTTVENDNMKTARERSRRD